MGAGKSRIGPLLGEILKCRFFDTDKLIEQQSGKKINKIFEEDGEEAFRKLENKMILELSEMTDRAVIALGGGALTVDGTVGAYGLCFMAVPTAR